MMRLAYSLVAHEQMEHPSALDEFEQIMSAIQHKKIVVFLDYDGTLSDIVDDPDKAFMTETVPLIQKFAYHHDNNHVKLEFGFL